VVTTEEQKPEEEVMADKGRKILKGERAVRNEGESGRVRTERE
jgi:hypothetical protein